MVQLATEGDSVHLDTREHPGSRARAEHAILLTTEGDREHLDTRREAVARVNISSEE